jgi:hypothetical protein
MPFTDRGIEYPDGSWTFPPGLSGDGGAFETMANSVDDAFAVNSFTRIDSILLGADATSITFSSIPNTFTDLILIWGGRKTGTNPSGGGVATKMGVRLNGDSTSNYYSTAWTINNADSGVGDYYKTAADTTVTIAAAGYVGFEASGGWVHIPRARSAVSKDLYGWGTFRTGSYGQGASKTVQHGYRGMHGASSVWENASVVSSITLVEWSGVAFASGFNVTLYGVPGLG